MLLYYDFESPVKEKCDSLMKTEDYQAQMLGSNPYSVCMTVDKSLDHSEIQHSFCQTSWLGLNAYHHYHHHITTSIIITIAEITTVTSPHHHHHHYHLTNTIIVTIISVSIYIHPNIHTLLRREETKNSLAFAGDRKQHLSIRMKGLSEIP